MLPVYPCLLRLLATQHETIERCRQKRMEESMPRCERPDALISSTSAHLPNMIGSPHAGALYDISACTHLAQRHVWDPVILVTFFHVEPASP